MALTSENLTRGLMEEDARIWDSTGPKGGLGAKFARVLTSEIVGIGASAGVKLQPALQRAIGTNCRVGAVPIHSGFIIGQA